MSSDPPNPTNHISIGIGEVISYPTMLSEENTGSLAKGMHYRLNPNHSVFLMSVRSGAPYDDEIRDEGRIVIYEGHNVRTNDENPIPQIVDQTLERPNGNLNQNGLFYKAAMGYKEGQRPSEKVRIYQKIKKGIWVYAGIFKLVDSWPEQSKGRIVYKFELHQLTDEELENLEILTPGKFRRKDGDLAHTRFIPTSVRLEVWQRDKGKCVKCKSEDNLHFDHLLPFSKGGTSLLAENIQLLCARHNLQKSDKIE